MFLCFNGFEPSFIKQTLLFKELSVQIYEINCKI
jgi:hypothetical protein